MSDSIYSLITVIVMISVDQNLFLNNNNNKNVFELLLQLSPMDVVPGDFFPMTGMSWAPFMVEKESSQAFLGVCIHHFFSFSLY